ncbi:hypothetical protein BaRGS_00029645 [Batillaria attramentaria]|uniref:Secreted protein n=1 Tax=Batillaria attramentaria TaxID=370345 RepID=A0ABD0JVW7_9CAEN
MHYRNTAAGFLHCLLVVCFVRDGVLSARIQLPQYSADSELAETVHNLTVSNDYLVSEMQRQAEVDATLASSVDEIRRGETSKEARRHTGKTHRQNTNRQRTFVEKYFPSGGDRSNVAIQLRECS